ncbi:MAG: portal protein [Alphaproteobacteria bacterium]|nr:portal protein [Alphaproteobacteria bacterium]MCL2889966.1 portal protein [Alphaproteobacteria bacterium]
MTEKIISLYKQSLAGRDAWTRRWAQCQRYTMPANDDDTSLLFDATAGDAVDLLAANMFSLLTPPESGWISLSRATEFSPDPEFTTDALRNHLNDSNFYTTIHQCYLDMTILGTACLFFAENPIGTESAFNFTAIPMNDISVLRGAGGDLTAVFHTTSMPAIDLMEKYPAWTPPAAMRDSIKQNPEMQLRLVQSVINDTDTWTFTAWIDCGGEIENNIVATGKFDQCPYIIFRWSAAAGESYGRSPVLRALPDIKTANKVVELVLKNATIAVSGIWQADDDGVINLSNINLTPGAIIPKAVGSSGLTPLRSGADFDVSQLVLGDLRARIRHALLADRLSILSDKEMTATEIIARNTDMMRVLGATYGRLLGELIRPLVSRGLAILARRGIIDPISLHNDARLAYVAPIAQLAADERATAVLSFLSTANNAGFANNVNHNAVMNYLATALHIPSELISQ